MRAHVTTVAKRTALLALAALVLLGATPQRAQAHGKEIEVVVTSLVPDARQPLVRLYRAVVVYAADGDPVDSANVVVSAALPGPGGDAAAMEPAALSSVDGRPGVYVGEMTYPRFGDWAVTVTVEAALGQGSGSSQFLEQLRPGALGASAQAALQAEGERVYGLQLQFGFGWWPDVVNIVVRVAHSLAAVAYFGAMGTVFAIAWLGMPAGRPGLPGRLARLFLPVTLGSLALLLASGLYSATFDAPVGPPGVFDFGGMTRLPYGEWYLAAFALKPLLLAALVVLAVRIHRALRSWPRREGVSYAIPMLALRRASVMSAAVAVAVVVDIAVVIYLHYASHLGVFLPEA